MPELRDAEREDYVQVERLHAQHVGPHHLSERSYRSWLGKCTVAVDGEEVLGFCFGNHASDAWGNVVVTPEPPERWTCSFISHLVVDRRHRRRGIGALLLHGFLEQGKRAGNSWVILDAASPEGGLTEKELHSFYRANDFRHLRHRPDEDGSEGQYVNHWLLGCQVSEGDGYDIAVLDSPNSRPAPPQMPPETEEEKAQRAQRIEEIKRRVSGPADHPLATRIPRGGRRIGF